MDFKKIEIKDMSLVRDYFNNQNSRMSDFSCGAFYIWAEYLETQYCVMDDALFIRFHDRRHDHFIYAYPITKGDIKDAISKINDNISSRHTLMLAAVPQEALEELQKYYDINYHYKREWSDYLYDAAEIREFKGKKYHDKRNHISRFIREYGAYTYESITKDNITEALEMLKEYKKTGEATVIAKYEQRKAREIIKILPELGLIGGMIKTGGKVVAVSAGELIGDTLFVHVEKALTEYNGVYAVAANEFAKQFPAAVFINREDDGGDEGLRKSKLSYNPIRLIDKYIVNIRGLKQTQE